MDVINNDNAHQSQWIEGGLIARCNFVLELSALDFTMASTKLSYLQNSIITHTVNNSITL